MTSVRTIFKKFWDEKKSVRDLGDKFERFVCSFLKNDPTYKNFFDHVWLWKDFPLRNGRADCGIDIVAQRNDGRYCAVQCKFYDPEHKIQKSDIDSFFTESGKEPFSSRIIVSTAEFGKNAEDALDNQQIPVTRIGIADLDNFDPDDPEKIILREKKKLRPHQEEAVENVISGFEAAPRGKLIMACGTGKTFTALKIAEHYMNSPRPFGAPPSKREALILFLVPSLSLLSQTLREWTSESGAEFRALAVCSDANIGDRESEDIKISDLSFPATTNAKMLGEQFSKADGGSFFNNTVIFSTYQSIQTISDAQAEFNLPAFDLIICDEAHRTTGHTLADRDESHFVRVHDQNFIAAKRRLYMTATPRIFSDASKVKAQENEIVLCSMDDEKMFGAEFHRLSFSEAVQRDLLSDYKVMVLAVDESYINASFQKQFTNEDKEIQFDDLVKIVGCWNGLAKKRIVTDEDETENAVADDPQPMRRAVAFTSTIKNSKGVENLFHSVREKYEHLKNLVPEKDIKCEVQHVDGGMGALERNRHLDWLREGGADGECRILSNARCLSEGIDVPSLDAVMFLSGRKSVVDVVQAVGRVMRKSPGKKFGYIILPVGVPSDIPPAEALSDNKKYKVIWDVLQALRAHDDTFNIQMNQMEFGGGGEKPPVPGGKGKIGGNEPPKIITLGVPAQGALDLDYTNLDTWRNALYSKIILKCGDKHFWTQWARDVAEIAEKNIDRINDLLKYEEHRGEFDKFLANLQKILNPSIKQNEAVEMLAQHLITEPVFNALFENYEFTSSNPVSVAMQKMLEILHERVPQDEHAQLGKFYESVRKRVQGVTSSDGRQKIILELYNQFFKTAFPRMAERLGIVYTPVEVVDFIIKSAHQALKKEFGLGLGDEGVHIIDPFCGTGTFIVRLLRSGLIDAADLERKYRHELHANEIVLLAYYIGAINIEETFHGLAGDYQPFDGMVLTDTFQLFEDRDKRLAFDGAFAENNERLERQKRTPITVIMSNPPYSVSKGTEYKNLDERIRKTYAEYSTGTNKNSLYDSYIRAIRWASERIADKGVICFVTNGSFIDGNAQDGLRKCLADEFSSIYCFNLRGNARTSGELRRKEKDNIFGMGTRTSVAITLLIKNPEKKSDECKIFYHDIGDYLSRNEKLEKIKNLDGMNALEWEKITPNAAHDWINPRDDIFSTFMPIGSKDEELKNETIFEIHSSGVKTNRDPWVYNFSCENLNFNVKRMIEKYNDGEPAGKKYEFDAKKIVTAMYRPFCKTKLYFHSKFNERTYQMPRIFPHEGAENLVICVNGVGVSKDFSVIISDVVPDVQLMANGQCFPLYRYEKHTQASLFGTHGDYTRRDNVNDTTLAKLHLNYENAEPFAAPESQNDNDYIVRKMTFAKKNASDKYDNNHKRTIIYNSHLRIENIPLEAYNYVVNGRSAIEWVMERYQVTTDKDSKIQNDPNNWSREHGEPRYIYDLLRKVITMSLESVKIIEMI